MKIDYIKLIWCKRNSQGNSTMRQRKMLSILAGIPGACPRLINRYIKDTGLENTVVDFITSSSAAAAAVVSFVSVVVVFYVLVLSCCCWANAIRGDASSFFDVSVIASPKSGIAWKPTCDKTIPFNSLRVVRPVSQG